MSEQKLLLIPRPRQIKSREGVFHFQNGDQIVLSCIYVQALFKTAQRLQNALSVGAAVSTGIVVEKAGDCGDIAVTLDIAPHKVIEEQEYTLDVTPEQVSIVGRLRRPSTA